MKVKPLRWKFVVADTEVAQSFGGKFSLLHMRNNEHQLCTPDNECEFYATGGAAKRAAERMHQWAVLKAQKELDKWFA